MNPPFQRLQTFIRRFELLIVVTLILLMMVVVAQSLVELILVLWKDMLAGPVNVLQNQEMLTVLGFFMMVLIALELLETIKNYLTENAIHVEVVLLVAMIAVARKVIILDMKELQPLTLFGIAALILSLAGSYWLLKKTEVTRK
ncbi:MAG: phosphate-starvation-inducible PsiE family protein [Verrucomicrobia bacterium]|nr:phosphate-starvation-inducible PsiE family protein [Verrucomicrobiota bacterium]MCH8526940.1 phosphate-starvation-inducible PsiE family protein [Kiritimatiellia bacterium]